MQPERRMAPLQIQNNCHLKPESAHLTAYLNSPMVVCVYSELKQLKDEPERLADTRPCSSNISITVCTAGSVLTRGHLLHTIPPPPLLCLFACVNIINK